VICDALPFGRLWYGESNAVSLQSATLCTTAVHMTPCFVFTMKRAMRLRRTSTRATSKSG